ncbi:hypothetical protein D9M72_519270 [compost metagenome]
MVRGDDGPDRGFDADGLVVSRDDHTDRLSDLGPDRNVHPSPAPADGLKTPCGPAVAGREANHEDSADQRHDACRNQPPRYGRDDEVAQLDAPHERRSGHLLRSGGLPHAVNTDGVTDACHAIALAGESRQGGIECRDRLRPVTTAVVHEEHLPLRSGESEIPLDGCCARAPPVLAVDAAQHRDVTLVRGRSHG